MKCKGIELIINGEKVAELQNDPVSLIVADDIARTVRKHEITYDQLKTALELVDKHFYEVATKKRNIGGLHHDANSNR